MTVENGADARNMSLQSPAPAFFNVWLAQSLLSLHDNKQA
jgi:hypothetical protein